LIEADLGTKIVGEAAQAMSQLFFNWTEASNPAMAGLD